MRKLFQLASLVLMSMMLFSIAPASAAFFPPPHPVTTSNGTVCTAICGAPTEGPALTANLLPLPVFDPCAPHREILGPVREAFTIGNIINGSDGLNGVNHPPRVTCGGKSAQTDCAFPLGHLPDVSEREVRSVDGRDRIKLIPICDRLNASLTQEQRNLAEHGNAETLVPAIAENVVLTAALGHARYRADDVVGIVMGTDTVMLYVHKM
jgi:hypothetical protein